MHFPTVQWSNCRKCLFFGNYACPPLEWWNCRKRFFFGNYAFPTVQWSNRRSNTSVVELFEILVLPVSLKDCLATLGIPTLQRSACGGTATFTNRCVQWRPVVSPYGRWSVPALTDSQRYPGASERAHGAFWGGAAGCPWEPQRAARNRHEAPGSAGSRRELLEAVGSHPTGAAGNRDLSL